MFVKVCLTRPGKREQKTDGKDPPCYENGKIHYFDWAIFNSYVTNYQRVVFCEFIKPSNSDA